ncbi:Calx-beta domain-containing protein [Rubrivirga sp.]|uniref:Calx-beta domain-containing protein n=1 Tax=Rubrivirga sp. TaxID=1885344 RepID=UPI003C762FFB
MKYFVIALGLLTLAASPAYAQRTADALLEEISTGPYNVGDDYVVRLSLKSPEGDRDVRDASVFIDFDEDALSFSGDAADYDFTAYSGPQTDYNGDDTFYEVGTVLLPESGTVSVNILNDFRSTEVGQALATGYTGAVEITFTVDDPAIDPGFAKDRFEVFYTDSGDPVLYTEGAFEVQLTPPPPTVTLAASPSSISEDGGVSTVTATLSESATSDVTVTLGFAGSAAGGDYTASANSITILTGQTTGTITVTGDDDSDIEGAETVEVSIDGVTNAVESGAQSATITLTDDDAAEVSVAAAGDATEGAAAGAFTIFIDQALTSDLEVTFATSGDTGDVAALGTTATITAGNTSVDVAVSATDDATVENTGSVTLTLSSTNSTQAAVGSSSSASVGVLDDDSATLTVAATAQAAEPGTDGAFTITSTAPAAFDVDVTVAVSGSATEGADFASVGTSVVLEAGETSVVVPVAVTDDDAFEGDETVVLTLSSTDAAAVTVGDPDDATVTIAEDEEGVITVSTRTVSVSETGTTATFSVTLPQAPTADVTIAVSSGDTDEATVSTGTLTFEPAGALSQTVTVTGVDDTFDDGDQSVTITLGAASSTDADFDGVDPLDVTATVLDDDAAPTVALTAAAATVLEGASTPVTATLTGATTVADVTVSLSATGDDGRYVVADEVVIPAGQTSASVPFTGTQVDGDQADLEVTVSISAVTGATEATPQAVTITVQDDDPTLVTLSASPLRIAEAGGASTVTATLTTPAPSPVTVTLGFSTDSADNADYKASATQIVVAQGQTSGTATVTAVGGDADGEGDETLTVTIDGVVGGDTDDGTQESGDQAVTITIQEAPLTPTIAFATTQSSVREEAGTVELELELDRDLEEAATVRVFLTSGDAADLDGFEQTEIEVPAATTSLSVSVPIADDQQIEDDETVVFGLEVVSGDLDVDAAATAVVIVDNDGQPVTVTVPVRDRDGDGVEDGGPRFFSVPVGGLTAGEIALEAGGSVSVIDPSTGGVVEAGPDTVLMAGQLIVVDVAPGADLTLVGSAAAPGLAQQAVVLEDGDEARVLVPLANLSDAPIAIGSLEVEGGVLSDIALVFDEVAGTFRPVSLAGLSESAIASYTGLVLQVLPTDPDNPDVTITTTGAAPAATTDVADAEFVPTDGETAVVLSLRPTADSGRLAASSPSDLAVLRLVEGSVTEGLDPFDGVSVSTSSVDLAFDGALPLAALAATPSSIEGGLDLGLDARVAPGTYQIDAAVLGDLGLDVFLVDGGAAVSLTEPYTFTVADGDDLSERFALRVASRITVANEDATLEVEVGLVFPNPTVGTAWLDLEVGAQAVQAEVLDLLGRSVARVYDGVHAGGALRLEVGAGTLAPGAYLVRVTGDSFSATRRLSVVR